MALSASAILDALRAAGIAAPSGLGAMLPGQPDASTALAEPAGPALVTAPVAPPPALGFRERLALGLSALPAPAYHSFESGGSRLGRGLLSGLAGGFAKSTSADYGQRAEAVTAANASNRASADRANAIATEQWKAKLSDYYKAKQDAEGNTIVNDAMIADHPKLAPFKGQTLPKSGLLSYVSADAGREPMVAIPNEPALAKYMGRKVGDMVKQSELLTARVGMKPPSSASTSSPEELQSRADIILQGIAGGTMNPNIELYGTNRDGLKGILAAKAVQMGLDLATLRQNWSANQKGLSTANSPQQLRMRQAANNISALMDQMAGKVDENGNREGGIIKTLHTGGQPWWNHVLVATREATGKAGPLKQYNILASKLAMEQAFLMSGGNQPPAELYKTLLHQYAATDNPANIYQALGTVDETVRGYQQSIADVGPITRSTPYVPGAQQQNPITAPGFNLGSNPPAGTNPPSAADDLKQFRKGN